MPYFWLSFCDPAKPPGTQFLGVAVVEAPSFDTVHWVAWDHGCNPGGEVKIMEIPEDEHEIFRPHLNRLMPEAELRARQFID